MITSRLDNKDSSRLKDKSSEPPVGLSKFNGKKECKVEMELDERFETGPSNLEVPFSVKRLGRVRTTKWQDGQVGWRDWWHARGKALMGARAPGQPQDCIVSWTVLCPAML